MVDPINLFILIYNIERYLFCFQGLLLCSIVYHTASFPVHDIMKFFFLMIIYFLSKTHIDEVLSLFVLFLKLMIICKQIVVVLTLYCSSPFFTPSIFCLPLLQLPSSKACKELFLDHHLPTQQPHLKNPFLKQRNC